MSVSNLLMNARRTYQRLFPEQFLQRQRKPSSRTQNGYSHGDLTLIENSYGHDLLLPSRTILLGQCKDGLPFLMKLGDPDIGAILIGCEDDGSRTHQLQVMVGSAMRTHFPHDLQIAILTNNPADWDSLRESSGQKKYLHCVRAWKDELAGQTIRQITDLAEARRLGQRKGTDVLFLLDDFDAVEELSYEAQVDLHWLLEYGSQSGVWLVGTINADLADGFRYWISTFRTRIVGRVEQAEDAEIMAMRSGSQASHLNKGAFRVWTGGSWLTYELPFSGV
jgi:hypothetical protein